MLSIDCTAGCTHTAKDDVDLRTCVILASYCVTSGALAKLEMALDRGTNKQREVFNSFILKQEVAYGANNSKHSKTISHPSNLNNIITFRLFVGIL